MTTAAGVIAEAKSFFQTSYRDEVNVLAANISSTSATTFTVTYETGGIDLGSVVEIDDEQLYVVGYNSSTKVATCIRGWNGTTAATHANASLVYVNPRVTMQDWLRHLNGELRSLSAPVAGLFKLGTVELTFNSARIGYNLTSVTAADDVIRVLAEQPGDERNWIPLQRKDWELQRDHSTSDFASGFALRILNGPAYPGEGLRVLFKQPFTELTSTSQDVNTDAGLPDTANDLLAVGMAIRAVAGREIARNFTDGQGNTRRADEVPPGAVQQSAAGLRALYRQRLHEEASRLIRKYGL